MQTESLHIVAHADWSTSASKRWMAQARRQADGKYLCEAPQPVERANTLLDALRQASGPAGCALVGFDFPIGLPLAYARRAGITDFLTNLPWFGKDQWVNFYEPAATPEQITLFRPFYPARAGSARQKHLVDRLGLDHSTNLRRSCERAHPDRRAACPLFWTLGAQQVGKAAISGWKEVLVKPTGIPDFVSIWPFSGRLEELIRPRRVVVAETYPAEFYAHLGVTFTRHRGNRSGKRVQHGRKTNAEALRSWADRSGVILSPALHADIQDGFGAAPDGEDRFDAVVGLFGMLNIAIGHRILEEPLDESIRLVEGWILGEQWHSIS
jgi:hypothetical protein